jgi:hypothetical protein
MSIHARSEVVRRGPQMLVFRPQNQVDSVDSLARVQHSAIPFAKASSSDAGWADSL